MRQFVKFTNSSSSIPCGRINAAPVKHENWTEDSGKKGNAVKELFVPPGVGEAKQVLICSENSSIFIGNAPIGIKVEKIKAHFLKTYPHISAIIYIDFIDAEAARNACQENQKIFEGKRLRVSLARERKPINKEATLFVGNLKYSTSEEQLFDEFVEFGEIDMVRIIAGKGFGFVHFADPASVDKAAVKNKIKFNGREIHVERSRPPIQKESSEQESIDRAIASQNLLKKQQAPGGYLNYRRNQTRNQLALELLERVINVQCRRPKSGIKF
ncbi:hypothetical protein pipiens_019683 [Culex pipiens pipiens]|uniref:RRM domain-containing protein n=1 Tax=Culex pipiens pipiens TaxID=38569 RepID=A0ABD1DSR8_CULPP